MAWLPFQKVIGAKQGQVDVHDRHRETEANRVEPNGKTEGCKNLMFIGIFHK